MESVTTRSGARLLLGPRDVTKWHRPGTDPAALARRLALWPDDVGLRLLDADLSASPPRTRWPRAEPMSEEHPDWQEAGALLGRLHRRVAHEASPRGPRGSGLVSLDISASAPSGCAASHDAPRHGWPARLARAAERAGPAWLRRLGAGLLDEVDHHDEPGWLIHGDFHLGQMGWLDGRWWLLDPDDLGAGDPAWDLARAAGFWAAGLLPDADWHQFVDGYRGTARTPLAAAPDPWEHLDLPARAAVFVAACRPEAHDPATAEALLEACSRMTATRRSRLSPE